MRNDFYKGLAFASLAVAFTACESNEEPTKTVIPYRDGAYVLNLGSGSNTASLSYFDFESQKVTQDIFANENNDEAMGDQGNHMCIYGSKMYIAMSGSAKIEVTDLAGKRLKKIQLSDSDGAPLKPRSIASHGNYVYFTSYGGLVQRIDTVALNLSSDKVQVGDFPEGLTVADEKLFVCNSKYTSQNVNDEGNTVSVIDLNTFTKIKDITVASNPYNQILTASDGNVYFISVGDWSNPRLQKINTSNYEVSDLGQASVIAAHGNTLYAYLSVWGGETWFKTYDIKNGKFSDNKFLDSSKFSYIQALNTNPVTGDLYISDAPSKMIGDVYIYNESGKEITSFEAGYSPNGVFFPKK